jgi:hypothetical protein
MPLLPLISCMLALEGLSVITGVAFAVPINGELDKIVTLSRRVMGKDLFLPIYTLKRLFFVAMFQPL